MLTYSLHGVTLESRFVFQNRLVPMEGRPDLVFTCCIGPLPPPPEELLWPRDGPGDITLYRTSDATVLRFADISCFALRAGRIDACLARREQLHLVEIQLFGMVLALWLEQRGVPVLHGAAVAPGDRAVAFLGSGGAGKTSMTASFLQVGAGLLTEDLLALEPTPGAVLAHPGHPQLRMWPDGARHFLRRSDGLAIVHPAFAKLRVPIGEPMIGELASRPLPLGAVYILERQAAGTGPSITPVAAGEALIALVRHSFVPELIQATAQAGPRFSTLAEIARCVPVFRLQYPDGLQRLPDTRRAILDHLEGLPRATYGDRSNQISRQYG